MKLWQDKIRKITPYVPGEQPKIENIIKLNTNENPYPPSKRLNNFINGLNTDSLKLYPSFECPELKEALCSQYGVEKNQIFLGNGSDEVLALAFMTFFNSDKPILFPDITYSFYDVWCELYNIKYYQPPLDENFQIKKEDYINENGGIVIANPNAPTGIFLELSVLEEIIRANPSSIVIIDEAYIDFGGQSAVGLINKYDNVVVVQTFSKSRSLAGIRVGYAMSNPELINAMEAVKNSFNSYTLSTPDQLIAAECAKDTDYLNECTSKIKKTRQYLISELSKLGFETLPSKSNFIFTTNPQIDAQYIFKYLRSKSIIVRYFNKPRINQYLRITIGTDEQIERLIEELKNMEVQK